MSLTPLYSILVDPVTVTIGTGGASVGATSIPVTALTVGIPDNTILDFGTGKFAKLAADADDGDTALDTAPIPTALVAGDEALYQPPTPTPLLSEAFNKLPSDAERLAHHLRAEMLLGLEAPVYEGTDAQELTFAIVLQINHQVAMRSLTSHLKSVSTQQGATETFRDRSVDPDAAMIVERVTGYRQVRYEPAGAGV